MLLLTVALFPFLCLLRLGLGGGELLLGHPGFHPQQPQLPGNKFQQ